MYLYEWRGSSCCVSGPWRGAGPHVKASTWKLELGRAGSVPVAVIAAHRWGAPWGEGAEAAVWWWARSPQCPACRGAWGGFLGKLPVLVVLQQGREGPRAPNRVGSQGEILTKGRAVRLQLLESFCISWWSWGWAFSFFQIAFSYLMVNESKKRFLSCYNRKGDRLHHSFISHFNTCQYRFANPGKCNIWKKKKV